jgi:hypothetical protein
MRLHIGIERAVLLLASLCAACGGAASDGGVSSGVPGSKLLSELSDSEALTLCRKGADFLLSSDLLTHAGRFSCKREAFQDAVSMPASSEAELRQICVTGYEECLAAGIPQQDPPDEGEDCQLADTTCTATVAEYEDCLDATPAWFKERAEAKPGCSTLTFASDAAEFTRAPVPPPPAACQRVIARCGPELWVDREGGE